MGHRARMALAFLRRVVVSSRSVVPDRGLDAPQVAPAVQPGVVAGRAATVHPLLALQHHAGNHAVVASLARRSAPVVQRVPSTWRASGELRSVEQFKGSALWTSVTSAATAYGKLDDGDAAGRAAGLRTLQRAIAAWRANSPGWLPSAKAERQKKEVAVASLERVLNAELGSLAAGGAASTTAATASASAPIKPAPTKPVAIKGAGGSAAAAATTTTTHDEDDDEAADLPLGAFTYQAPTMIGGAGGGGTRGGGGSGASPDEEDHATADAVGPSLDFSFAEPSYLSAAAATGGGAGSRSSKYRPGTDAGSASGAGGSDWKGEPTYRPDVDDRSAGGSGWPFQSGPTTTTATATATATAKTSGQDDAPSTRGAAPAGGPTGGPRPSVASAQAGRPLPPGLKIRLHVTSATNEESIHKDGLATTGKTKGIGGGDVGAVYALTGDQPLTSSSVKLDASKVAANGKTTDVWVIAPAGAGEEDRSYAEGTRDGKGTGALVFRGAVPPVRDARTTAADAPTASSTATAATSAAAGSSGGSAGSGGIAAALAAAKARGAGDTAKGASGGGSKDGGSKNSSSSKMDSGGGGGGRAGHVYSFTLPLTPTTLAGLEDYIRPYVPSGAITSGVTYEMVANAIASTFPLDLWAANPKLAQGSAGVAGVAFNPDALYDPDPDPDDDSGGAPPFDTDLLYDD
ncbi:MAG: hypothetical protein JWN67_3002 [Actinomycetia bacterium]|nr:hypothetical protein [Actinomycetes bacterium]